MTYRLEPIIGKIVCPVMLVFPDGKQIEYSSGTEACGAAFDHKYVVEEVRAVSGVIEIKLKEVTQPITNWTGEEQTFF